MTEPVHAAAEEDPDVPGCEVLGFIGRGGMGAVYKARQQSLNRMVAVKLLSIHTQPEGLDFASRFRVEAQAMARLAHPNIVSVHDFGTTHDGRFYYVMELVEGSDLSRKILETGRLRPPEALRIILAVCAALECAHAQGVVHRDIKPSNILISQAGVVKVADFGLAKVDDPSTASLTISGTTMGSHGYAAPEVFAKASQADHRTDIYSLGVLLYQMLTGDLPRGMFKLPSEKVPGLDARLDEIICKCMEEDREERYQSITELREPLEEVFASFTAPALPITPVEVVQENALARRESGVMVRLSWKRVALAAAAVLTLGTALWHGNKPEAAAISQAEPPREEGWQNLLTPLDIKKQSVIGHWAVENGVLANRYDTGTAVIEFPVETPMNYDLRVRMTPQRNTDGYLVFALRHGKHAGAMVIDDSHAPVAGLEHVDGKRKLELPETVQRPTPFLPLGSTYDMLFHVRDEGLLVLVNGEPLYRWKGDWSRATLAGPWLPANHGGRPFIGIGGQSSKIQVHSVEYRPVTSAAAQSLPGVSFDPATALASTLPPSTPKEFRGHRYRYVPGQFTWDEARVNAISLGGHLATLTDEAENHWVWSEFSKYLPSLPRNYCDDRAWWIGGSFSKEDNAWSWITGEPFQYTCWSALKPPAARVPRLKQHDNGGGGGLSTWTQHHYSSHFGYLVEWDDLAPPDVTSRTVNLMPLVNLPRDALAGSWSREGSELHVKRQRLTTEEGGLARLELPYEPPEEYDFEMEFTPQSGEHHVYQMLSAAGRSFAWAMNVHMGSGFRAGFLLINGKSLNEQFGSTAVRDAILVNGRRHRSKVEVRKDQVRGYLDGELLVTYGNGPDSFKALDIAPYLGLRDPAHLGIAAQDRALVIHKMEVRDVRDAPARAASENLTDAQQREFVAWVLSQPRSTDPLHVGATQVPDLMIAGSGRNLRKVEELPQAPFAITRVRLGPVRMDAETRKQFGVIAKLPELIDLRIYGAEQPSVLECLHHKSGVITVICRSAGQEAMADQNLAHLARLTNLRVLRLEDWGGLTGQGLAHLKEKLSLYELGLPKCPDLTDEGLGELSRFTQLKTLTLTVGPRITDAGLAKLAKLTNLEKLTLSFLPEARATGSGLAALAGLTKLRWLQLEGSFPGSGLQYVGKLASLEELQCWQNMSVTDETVTGLSALPKLQVLRLDNTGLKGTGFAGFRSCPNLLELRIDDCYISDDGLRAIASGIPQLEYITLSRNKPTYSLPVMVEELSKLKALTRFHGTYRFKDEDLTEVAKLTNLRFLALQFSSVTDAGIAKLKPLVNLTELQLAGLPLTHACIPALVELRNLTKLDITGTNITAMGCEAIKRALPECTIKR